MQSIQSILQSQPKVNSKILSATGICVWICWSNGAESRVATMLEESGGLEISNTPSQSLWFFFNIEVALYALAKLDIWGKQFSTGLTSFTFPGELVVDPERNLSLEVDPSFSNIVTDDPLSMVYVFAHPALWPHAASLPGLSFYDMTILEKQGLFGWKMITADRRLPFSVEQGWFAFLHPVGNPLDKQFQRGWEKIFANIEPLLDEHKLKYSLQSGFLSVSIGTIQQLRAWTEQILVIFDDIREQHQDIYWPCLSIVVDKNNLNFTTDLHEKLNIDWINLAPDHPYLNYKNAFLLGKKFSIHDISYSSQPTDIQTLCTVALKELEMGSSQINPIIAKVLTPGESTCFYCGSGTHEPLDCPTKVLQILKPDFWKEFKKLDFSDINNSYRSIDADVNAHGTDAYMSMLATENPVSNVLRGTFAINASCQLPNVERIWQITSRDIDEVPEKVNPQKEPSWGILKRLTQMNQDLNAIERDCASHIAKDSKSWQLQCLAGFIAMEKKDFSKAARAWRDAESICTTTAHQGWLKFLVARLKEVQGSYNEAYDTYTAAQKLLPLWKDLEYRMYVCKVKMGFGQTMSATFVELVLKSPELFHKVLLDPELARGRRHMIGKLSPIWEHAYNRFMVDRTALQDLLQTLQEWFSETDNPMVYYGANIRKLLDAGTINNYVLFMEVAEFRPRFEDDLTRIIAQEITGLKHDYENCLNEVEFIRDEMNWFYFQKVLIDFNATFNDCARLLNWAFISNFNDVIIFKEAKDKLPELQELVVKLKKKLRKLRMVRDITLFALLMTKTFLRTSIILVVLVLTAIFTLLFFGDSLSVSWTQSFIKVNFWGLLKVTLSIALMFSFGISSLKTTILFDKRKNALLETAKEERVRAQQIRIMKAKKRRKEEEKEKKKQAFMAQR